MMRTTWGTQLGSIPEGFSRRVKFPVLAHVDLRTADGRKLLKSGFSSRDLPLTLKMQDKVTYGHDGAVIVGRLDWITVEDDGVVSAGGFLLDDEVGNRAARYVATQSLRGNSIDVAEAKVEVNVVWEQNADGREQPRLEIDFIEAKVGATTIVSEPAFADARIELDEDDITAALAAPEGLVSLCSFSLNFACPEIEEAEAFVAGWQKFTADEDEDGELAGEAPKPARKQKPKQKIDKPADQMLPKSKEKPKGQHAVLVWPFADFIVAEPDRPQPIKVRDGVWVSGHLALWDEEHQGFIGQNVKAPRNGDYPRFNKSEVETDAGTVLTGPILLVGGHKATAAAINDAMEDTANVWADVHCIDGKLGPWVSGRVRPGVDPEKVYVAKASRISGHWRLDQKTGVKQLRAIASVNCEGFDVPAYQVSMEDGVVTDLVASWQIEDVPESPAAQIVQALAMSALALMDEE
jgi:hypothetical protein